MSVPVGQFCWNGLLTTAPDAAKNFLAETLGWWFDNFSFGGPPCWVIRSGEAMVGGLGGLDAGDIETAQSYWLGFVQVDRIDERWERALAAGAFAIREPRDVPNVGASACSAIRPVRRSAGCRIASAPFRRQAIR